MRTVPLVGVSNPPIIRRIVDLPLPDGPRSVKNEPRSMPNDTLSTATTELSKTLRRPFTSTSISATPLPPRFHDTVRSDSEQLPSTLSNACRHDDERERKEQNDDGGRVHARAQDLLRDEPVDEHRDGDHAARSEERRVGKECRSRWAP